MTDLDEIERLLAKATEGPWQHHLSHVYGPDPMRTLVCQFRNGPWLVSDRDLIVALRNAAPAMIAELKALRRAAAMGELTASTAGEYGEVEACVSGWEVDAEQIAADLQQRFPMGTRVRKASGPQWDGVVCGYYSSTFTPEGLVIECTAPGAMGQVHVEPAKRMEVADAD